MKKILAIFICVLLLGIMPIVASAEETIPDETPGASETVEETTTETAPTVTETVPEKTFTETIVEWVQNNLAYITVIATSILIAIYDRITRGKMSKTLATVNNNSVAISQSHTEIANSALTQVAALAETVTSFNARMDSMLDEIKKTADEKKSLEDTIAEVVAFMKATKLAALEASNEVAELLVLANIPTSKKEELYARHIEAVRGIEAAEGEISNGAEA